MLGPIMSEFLQDNQSIKTMIDFIMKNKEWIFSGIGVTILGLLGKFLFKKNKPKSKNVINNNITINNQSNLSQKNELVEEEKNRLKDLTRILFIDDDTKFKVVSIMKKYGWKNTKSIKDIVDLDDSDAKNADIIFVDINGVATELFNDQGLGLAAALKEKYHKKKIVLYSADPTGDRFHKSIRIVDACLPKNAEPYEFINLVEQLSGQIYKL